MNKPRLSFFNENRTILIFLLVMMVLPFIIGLFEGSAPALVWNNEGTYSKFIQGLLIEIFILALFAMSYDLLFGISGLLSFGHAMFFASAAYATGMLLKFTSFPFWVILVLIFVISIAQAILFSLVLPRVKGITFAWSHWGWRLFSTSLSHQLIFRNSPVRMWVYRVTRCRLL